MKTTLIKTDAQLREYIPNAFTTCSEEVSLFDKIKPNLVLAEKWVTDNLTSERTFTTIAGYSDDNVVRTLACRICVCHAFAAAIPSLDLVLTPNGFGIVSNQNVAPASAERVDRLISKLLADRDELIECLLPLLVSASQWNKSDQYAYFSATLFPNITLSKLMGNTQNHFDNYRALRMSLLGIEQTLAEKYISPELYAIFREMVINNSATDAAAPIIAVLQQVELSLLKGDALPYEQVISLVNTIRNNETAFPEWQTSATAELFRLPQFENKKKSTGYWW